MRKHIGRTIALIALSALITAAAFADGWKVGVGGGRITGYMGLLADRGMPREYLTDEELADIEVLREYRAVIVTAARNHQAVARAVEQFVAEGGIAITEERVAPSAKAVPGKRLGPESAANIVFRDYDHPISRSMHAANVVTTYARPALAIIPGESTENVTVLAEYTDQGVPDKYKGKLTGGRKGIPAVLLVEHGEGAWLYFGPRVGFSLALRGPEMQPAILTALDLLSDGVLTPRFTSVPAERRILPSIQWQAQTREVMPRSAPRDAEASDLPEDFEPLDLPADAPADYVITGTLPAGGDATVMLPWFNPQWQQRLEIRGRKLRLVEVSDGRESVVAEGARPEAGEDARIDVRRRPRSVTVFIDGRGVLMAALDPLAGEQAISGVEDAFLQGCAPVQFTDNFMRAEGDPNPWETPSGNWQLYQVEGEPGQGANPFAFRAKAEKAALATGGYWFWDDYDAGVSVRPNCSSVSLMTHWQAEDDCIELRLTMPSAKADDRAAKLELIRRLPEREVVLATADASASRDRWQRLRLKVSQGHAVASLNERELIRVADDSLRGRGQVGLRMAGGFAHFDDVRVQPWQAAPLPINGGAWIAERGGVTAEGREVTLTPTASARAIAPITELADLEASAKLQRADATSAGLLLRHQSPGDHYLVAVAEADGGGSELQVIRKRRNEDTVLAAEPLEGGAGRWHAITATLRGRQMQIATDSGVSVEVADETFAAGGFGLACEGGAARFRDVTCGPIDRERFAADPETPPHAGIIDLHTWAGAGSGWEPAPTDLDLFWHRGMYVGDAEARLGVHRTGDGAAAATLLIGDGDDASAGYALSASQPTSADPVEVSLTRAGEEVASGETRVWAAEGWGLSLQRVGSLVVGRVDGETICSFRDPQPLAEMRRVGFRKDNAVIVAADAEVLSSAVRTWTFEEAPTDWRVESGTWEISNRWSCSPDWTWLAGWNQEGRALIESRRQFIGDQIVDIYVGTKMMPRPDGEGHYEELRDLQFGLCGDGDGGGYQVILGGNNGRGAQLLRDGEIVATNDDYAIPQSERHNNWLLVRLVKTGAELSVQVWDSEVLTYTDDGTRSSGPLSGGSVAVGTEGNGITVPRVTVYAQTSSGM
ncbi:MAG: hypothetical protein ACQER1_13825 [Armatimonadota bacterium]